MDFYGLEIVQGRAFASAPGAEGSTSYILNETAVKRMGLKDPIGRAFGFWKIDGTIVGVMKDFHFQPLNTPIAPLGLSVQPPSRLNRISLKVDAADVAGVLTDLKAVWNRYATAYPFQYDFLEDTLDMVYKKEQNLAEGFGGFTLIALFVAGLGLYGLASFSAERRTREIGIRKVLGAGVPRLAALLARDFAKWIALALLLAAPAAFFAMSAWLRTFAYRISPPLSAFLLSGLFVFLSAALTVGRHMFKAATANPVHSLRQE
jgi:putative ABC transport system permease protein